MNTVAVMQPTYLPWCGYFDLIDRADVFVLLDTVAIDRQSWQTRNRIRARDGNVVWLSVPVHAHMGQPLNEVGIATGREWQIKQWRTLRSAYTHGPHWAYVEEAIWPILNGRHWCLLALLNGALIHGTMKLLNIRTKLLWASSLARTRHNPIHRLADICQSVGATEYLSPAGARDYLEGHDIGVPIRWHEYEHPIYDQGGAPFMSHLSIVDLLAWHGPESLEIIRSGRKTPVPAG